MRIKHKHAVHNWIQVAKAINGSPTMIVNLPVAMADTTQYPGADRWVLAAVYPIDGKAVVVPSTLRCGILVCDWSKFMRYLRRRNTRR